MELEIEAETVGELKEEAEETIGWPSVKDWRLFQFGFLLPNESDTKFADFRLAKQS